MGNFQNDFYLFDMPSSTRNVLKINTSTCVYVLNTQFTAIRHPRAKYSEAFKTIVFPLNYKIT